MRSVENWWRSFRPDEYDWNLLRIIEICWKSWKYYQKLFQKSEPIDLLTVSAQLKKDSKLELCGGDFYLISLTQKVSSSAHIEFHARIILQKYIQRSLIKISNEIIMDSYDETKDVFDLLDNAEAKLYDVTQGNIKKSSETAQNLVFRRRIK